MLLIVANVAVFAWQTQYPSDPALERAGLSSGIDASAVGFGAIPFRVTHPDRSECSLREAPRPAEIVCGDEARGPGKRPLDQAAWWVTLFSSMFMHGGVLHLAGNMLFLWVFGNNIEDSMGRARFLAFYVLAGLVAVYAQSLLDTGSTVPTIGASGAVAGVLGGYALLHPRARVLTLIFLVFFITLIEIPAAILLGIWFLLQFLPAIGQTAITDLAGGDNVAYLAHVAGFVFGLAAIKLFVRRGRGSPAEPAERAYAG